jgi:hypothetical protein
MRGSIGRSSFDIITDDRRSGEAPFDFCPEGERAGSESCDGGGGERGGETADGGVTFVQCKYKREREDIPCTGGINFRCEGGDGICCCVWVCWIWTPRWREVVMRKTQWRARFRVFLGSCNFIEIVNKNKITGVYSGMREFFYE